MRIVTIAMGKGSGGSKRKLTLLAFCPPRSELEQGPPTGRWGVERERERTMETGTPYWKVGGRRPITGLKGVPLARVASAARRDHFSNRARLAPRHGRPGRSARGIFSRAPILIAKSMALAITDHSARVASWTRQSSSHGTRSATRPAAASPARDGSLSPARRGRGTTALSARNT